MILLLATGIDTSFSKLSNNHMSIINTIGQSIRGLFSPGSVKGATVTSPSGSSIQTPNVLPVPTPNPGAGGSAGSPTAQTFNTQTQSWEDKPSWDYQRFGNTYTEAKANPQAKANLASNVDLASMKTSSTPSGSSGGGSSTIDAGILQSKFGINDPNTMKNILNNPDERARYEREYNQMMNPGSGDQPAAPPLTKEELRSNLDSTKAGKYLDDNDLSELLDKYGQDARNRTNELAGDIETRARLKAQRAYDTIKGILLGQKAEAETLAGEQKTNIAKDKELASEELTAKETKEKGEIEKQKGAYEIEVQDTAEQLAQNWRDMSLEVQRISRGQGRGDTAFAGEKETRVLLDFNKGLKRLSQTAIGAVKDFSDAVTETVSFYTREQAKLDNEARKASQGVDSWLRSRVAEIQGKTEMALNDQLDAIDDAVTQADTLRIQTEQKIADQKLAYGQWLAQAQMQLQMAVASAAKGKVDSAIDSIAKYRDMAKETFDLVTKGGYQMEMVTNKDGTKSFQVHGVLPTGEDDIIQLTPEGYKTLGLNVAGSISGKQSSNNPFGTSIGETSELYQNVLNTIPGMQSPIPAKTVDKKPNPVLDALGSLFGN